MVNSCSDVFVKLFLRKTLIFVLTLSGQVMTVKAQESFTYFSDLNYKRFGTPPFCSIFSDQMQGDRCLEMVFSTNFVRGVARYDVLSATNLVRTKLTGKSLRPADDFKALLHVRDLIQNGTSLFDELHSNKTHNVRSRFDRISFYGRLDGQEGFFSHTVEGDQTTNGVVMRLDADIEDAIRQLRKQYPQSAQCVTQYFERATVPARATTISQILQDPSVHYGKRVRVSGYLQRDETGDFIEPDTRTPSPFLYDQSLHLGGYVAISEIETSKSEALGKVFWEALNTRKKIWVEGLIITHHVETDIYDNKSKGVGQEGVGTMGLWKAAIDDISDAGFILDESISSQNGSPSGNHLR